VCWCELGWHTVGAMALIAQSGTERGIQSHWTFVLLFSARTLSEKVFEWSLLSVHVKKKITAIALSRTFWCA